MAYLSLGVIAAILAASHMPVGAALSMDSLYYLSTASNILTGNGIALDTFSLSGPAVRPMTLWPPLYPATMAGATFLAEQAGAADVIGLAVLNFLALLMSMLLILRIAALATSVSAGVVAAIALAISPSVQIVFTYAWSEVLFIPLSLAAYLSLQSYLMETEGSERRGLYFMVLLLGLATYTRYVGLAFFAAAACALLVYGRGRPTERIRTVAAATVSYLLILAPMLLRNLVVSGSLSGGDRGAPGSSLLSDVSTLGWYLYLEFVNLPALPAAAVIATTVAAAAWLIFRSSKSKPSAHWSFDSSSIFVPFLFVVCYLAFLLISRSRQVIDLDSRMLSVVVPFMLLGIFGVYQYLAMRTRSELAALPFLLPLAAFAINAVHTHTSILTGWRELGEPGPVLGKTYLSITGRQLDSLRAIGEYFSPGAGDLVLTDISRPLIVDYLYPESDVRKMPDRPDEQSVALLEDALSRRGLAIIGDAAWAQALTQGLEGRARFYRFEARTGGPEFLVIKLPVEGP